MNTREPAIVGFVKDWDDVPTCSTHVLRHMGQTYPVLWISSIGTRKPRPGGRRDWRRLLRRLRGGLGPAELKEGRLRVMAPLLVPKAQSGPARWLNRRLFRWLIARELRDMGGGPVEYWCFVPNAVDLLPPPIAAECGSGVRGSGFKIIYYCVDDWTQFRNLDGEWLGRKEAELLARADVVFAASRFLAEKCERAAGSKVHYVPHGVEYGKFAGALDPALAVPDDVAHLAKPIIGFYGNIRQWIDFDLIAELAARRPAWQFVLIGPVFCDISRFARMPNVHFIGRREHDRLPGYCKAFGAAIIPYDLRQPRMASVHPVKTRELLAAGVPIVASAVPELKGFDHDILLADSVDEWIRGLERQLDRQDRAAISERVRPDDWAARVRRIRAIVDEVA
ncbi:MAG: glycosyltransferase [Kiritimatiellae bacterium]|nr:glycosyltransferase [Kiritimatiellia bacterium]